MKVEIFLAQRNAKHPHVHHVRRSSAQLALLTSIRKLALHCRRQARPTVGLPQEPVAPVQRWSPRHIDFVRAPIGVAYAWNDPWHGGRRPTAGWRSLAHWHCREKKVSIHSDSPWDFLAEKMPVLALVENSQLPSRLPLDLGMYRDSAGGSAG